MALGQDENRNIAQAFMPPQPIRSANVTIGAASAQSAAVNAATRFVRLKADADCYVNFGPNPTAVAGNVMLSAGDTEYFAVDVGQSWKVAVIQKTAGGLLNVSEF